ncbi:hypothetical protein EYF80_029247 [Liparis tanakae]|uniref:Uncharacterized protein n=1 Tax=Liparis tanakae TaxID=230148 RepID=A0A4Z2H6T3_9TELE|nr:hypothetical protein EYF80_029247 [Liparis tanakae]
MKRRLLSGSRSTSTVVHSDITDSAGWSGLASVRGATVLRWQPRPQATEREAELQYSIKG